MYDIAIIGTGPAGLEAALTLKNRNKSFLLIGNPNLSDKINKAHEIKNYLGLPNIKGEDLKNAFINQLNLMDIKITNDNIKQIYDLGSHYALQGEKSSEFYEAKSIIIATGMKMDKPFNNEERLLGMGISYCATCDAPLYKNKNIAIYIDSIDELDEVKFLLEVTNHVDLFLNFDIDYKNPKLSIHNEKIIDLIGEKTLEKVKTDSIEYEVDGLFILRKSVPLTYLISGIKMNNNHIDVNRNMETNLRGVFACGDCTGLPYQYIKAAGEGNVAALSAVNFLKEE